MTAVSVKHILIVVMVVLALVRLSINKRIKIEKKMELQKTSAGILVLNSLLGIVVLFLSAMI
jgi:putative copper export protein